MTKQDVEDKYKTYSETECFEYHRRIAEAKVSMAHSYRLSVYKTEFEKLIKTTHTTQKEKSKGYKYVLLWSICLCAIAFFVEQFREIIMYFWLVSIAIYEAQYAIENFIVSTVVLPSLSMKLDSFSIDFDNSCNKWLNLGIKNTLFFNFQAECNKWNGEIAWDDTLELVLIESIMLEMHREKYDPFPCF